MRSLLYIFLILNVSSCRDAKRVDPLIQDEVENRNKTIEQRTNSTIKIIGIILF